MKRYRYLGPADLRGQVVAVEAVAVDAFQSLDGWLAARDPGERGEPFPFVASLDGLLRLAPRRREHVTLAGVRDVLAAGQIAFVSAEASWRVVEVTNQSTGYCPDPHAWRSRRHSASRRFHRRGGLPALSYLRRTQHRVR
jgi:hypothetical protein